ncbi:hypothetical protein PI125_g12795 [Phytophthora idaei]|nr:hypothetical protein PI125_g12795 [Phytophthora idaei]KAG3148175.1 hypothetical protein PI126_g12549 [Phytophthora idaei]
MRLFLLVLTIAVSLVVVSSSSAVTANDITQITTTKSTLIHNVVLSLDVVTRELSGDDAALEERIGGGGHGGRGHGGRGGGGHGGGHDGGAGGVHGVSEGEGGGTTTTREEVGRDTPTGWGYVYGAHTSTGSMNTNDVTHHKERMQSIYELVETALRQKRREVPGER